jgi:hypothetical protein
MVPTVSVVISHAKLWDSKAVKIVAFTNLLEGVVSSCSEISAVVSS